MKINSKTIFVDLDGTLLDVSSRYYNVYRDIVSRLGGKPLSKKRYWSLKRSANDSEILRRSKIRSKEFRFYKERFSKIIEESHYLKYDVVVPGSRRTLRYLKRCGDRIILVTLRKSKKRLFSELASLKILKYVDDVLVSDSKEKLPWRSKADTIKRFKGFNAKTSLIIGDTEVDILCGKILGVKTVCVSNGLRTSRRLSEFKPHSIVSNISCFAEFQKSTD